MERQRLEHEMQREGRSGGEGQRDDGGRSGGSTEHER